ncbi:hypothetical protein AK830_g7084 [Neonectria ditissima]|uniref:Uncharacterized protein n=1 Tax=Neonectria ditissima TaxID=78410 RepID=A0A0P7ANV4_9HYPO|nr:hypothetical protein AK830_g7084 [Neonectria ditissima]
MGLTSQKNPVGLKTKYPVQSPVTLLMCGVQVSAIYSAECRPKVNRAYRECVARDMSPVDTGSIQLIQVLPGPDDDACLLGMLNEGNPQDHVDLQVVSDRYGVQKALLVKDGFINLHKFPSVPRVGNPTYLA